VVDRDAGCDALVFLDPALVERVGEARTRARQVRLQVAVSAAVTGTATGAGGAAGGRARRRPSDGGRRRAIPAGGGWGAVAATAAGEQYQDRYHEQGDQRAESLPRLGNHRFLLIVPLCGGDPSVASRLAGLSVGTGC